MVGVNEGIDTHALVRIHACKGCATHKVPVLSFWIVDVTRQRKFKAERSLLGWLVRRELLETDNKIELIEEERIGES